MLKADQPNHQPVSIFGLSNDGPEDRGSYSTSLTGAGATFVLLYTPANMPGPAVPPEGYTAFLPPACGILDARLVGFDFGHHLFVPGAQADRGFLPQIAAGIDGQAAFRLSATGSGTLTARFVLRVITVGRFLLFDYRLGTDRNGRGRRA